MTSESKPAYEIISFPVSDAYLKDPKIFDPVTTFIGEHAPGMYVLLLMSRDLRRMLMS